MKKKKKKKTILFVAIVLCLALGIGGVLFCAPYSAPSKAASGQIPEKIERYGLSTTLSGIDCYLEQLDELKKDGITHVEICLREDYEEQAALFEEGVKKIKDAGLEIWSVHLPFGETVSPAAPDEATRQANVVQTKKFVDLTEGCGAQVYVIHASYEPIAPEDRTQMLDSAVKSLAEVNTYVQEKNARLALENLPRTCIGNALEDMSYIAEQIPDLSLCFDTNHFTPEKPNYNVRPLQRLFPSLREKMNPSASDPVTFAQKFADRIITVHISDFDGIDECHWFPGQGIVDFYGIHTALMDAGFDAPIMFEPNEKCKGLRTTGKRLITGYEKSIGLQ